MDILALALGGAPNPDNEAPQPAAAGFDNALTQAQNQGEGVPPGGPPGPEPPPTVKVAGEGVTINEPNAQSKTPDFLPLPEGNVDAIAQALTESEGNPDVPLTGGSPTPTDDSDTGTGADDEVFIETFIAQLTPGLFASPQSIATVTIPVETPSADVSVNAVDSKAPTQPAISFAVAEETAQPTFEIAEVPQGQTFEVPTPTVLPTQVPTANADENQTPIATAPAIEGETVAAAPNTNPNPTLLQGLPTDAAKVLNIESVKTDAPETDTDTEVEATVATQPVQTEGKPKAKATATETETEPVALRHPGEKQVKDGDILNKRTTGQKSETEAVEEAPVKQGNFTEKVQRADKPAKDSEPVQANETTRAADTKGAQSDAKQGDTAQKGNQDSVKTIGRSRAKDQAVEVTIDTAQPHQIGTQTETTVRTVNETTATPKADQPLPPKEVDLVVKQVADRLQMLAAARPKNGVTVHLNPDDLGTITLVVKSIGQQVDAQFFASDQRVCQALDQNQTRLSEAMGQRGFQLQSVSVSQQTNNSTNSQSQQRDWQNQTTQQGQNDQARQQSQGEGRPRHFRQELAVAEPERAWRYATSGVDLEI